MLWGHHRGGFSETADLGPLLDQALGAEGAQRALAHLGGMMRREQYGWILTPAEM